MIDTVFACSFTMVILKKYQLICLSLCRQIVMDFLGSTLSALLNVLPQTSLVAQTVKRMPAMWETWVRSLGWEDPLEKEMATHSSTLAWKIPWTEGPGRLQFMGSQRVAHNWATSLSFTGEELGIFWDTLSVYSLEIIISIFITLFESDWSLCVIEG